MVSLNVLVGACFIFHAHGIQMMQPEGFNHEKEVKRLFSGPFDLDSFSKNVARHQPNDNSSDPYDDAHREMMLKGCGEICDATITGNPGKYFNEVRKKVDCMGLYSNVENDAPAKVWPPPRQIPKSMERDFSRNGKIVGYYLHAQYSGNASYENVWTKALVEETMELARKGQLRGTYTVDTTNRIRSLFMDQKASIQGKHMYVIGSETPWIEALLLLAGAEHVTTIEYGSIRSEHPRVSTMLPSVVREKYLNNTLPLFDGGATFSSLEHSGLGRYGDTLNPWGDLQAMAKAWCITKDNGPMFAGVPTAGHDRLAFNAHRIYGKERWAQLMANWKQMDHERPLHYNQEGTMYYFTKLPPQQKDDINRE